MSDVARLMQLIAEQEESALLGLHGLAAQARHDAIITRMEQGANALLPLFEQGRGDEAIRLWQEKGLERIQ